MTRQVINYKPNFITSKYGIARFITVDNLDNSFSTLIENILEININISFLLNVNFEY